MENKHRSANPVYNPERGFSQEDDAGWSKYEVVAREILLKLLETRPIRELPDMEKVVKDANDIARLMFNEMEQK